MKKATQTCRRVFSIDSFARVWVEGLCVCRQRHATFSKCNLLGEGEEMEAMAVWKAERV